MSQISYQFDAIDRRGVRTRGVLRAPSRREAYRQVCAVGLQPVRIRVAKRTFRSRNRITLRDIAHFTQQFAVLMQARIPIVDGLAAIADQESNPRLQTAIRELAANVGAGNNLSDALEAHRGIFGDVYVNTLRAAERTGNINEALANLTDMLEREYEMRKRLKGALLYPALVVSWIVVAVAFLMIVVVPRFSTMFAGRGLELPLPTQVLMATSGFLATWWPVLLGAVIGFVWSIRWAWRSGRYRMELDELVHRVPLLREIIRGSAVGRFAQVLGLGIRSGLSLIESLELAGRASGRPLLLAEAERLAEQVKQGGRLADVLLTCSYLPPFTRRMLAAGEEAAELPRMCAVISGHCERETMHLARNVTDLIEPFLIVVLAGVVLVVALAIFLPIWNMAALLG